MSCNLNSRTNVSLGQRGKLTTRTLQRDVVSSYLIGNGDEKYTVDSTIALGGRDLRRNSSKFTGLRISSTRWIFSTDIRPSHKATPPTFHSNLISSDNGGSTSEISRVIGGPGIGDIRSRLIRLMNDSAPEQAAIKKLMSHRLSSEDGAVARTEWLQIEDGIHPYIPSVVRTKWQVVGGDKFREERTVEEFLTVCSERYIETISTDITL